MKKVKQIGDKTFIQCAGFVRIVPLTAGIKNYNLLDSTNVHPESYDLAKTIIHTCGANVKEIGSPTFIEKIKMYSKQNSLAALANRMNAPEERVSIQNS